MTGAGLHQPGWLVWEIVVVGRTNVGIGLLDCVGLFVERGPVSRHTNDVNRFPTREPRGARRVSLNRAHWEVRR